MYRNKTFMLIALYNSALYYMSINLQFWTPDYLHNHTTVSYDKMV